jgi:glucan biosynthesis protein C
MSNLIIRLIRNLIQKTFFMSVTTTAGKSERIHALDSLRAIMMLLGLVIHSAITYGTIDYGDSWALKDPENTNLLMDYIVIFIHAFRMPIFFVVAGFFGAMLFFERTPKKMLKNRIDRILYPFLIFILILAPSLVFATSYSIEMFSNNSNPFMAALEPFNSLANWLPSRTYHLWFLYYLFLITIASYLLGLLFNHFKSFTNQTTKALNWILQKPILKVLFFSSLTFVLLLFMGDDWVATSTSWVLDFNTFIFYFFFYFIGWILFKSKELLDTFMKYDWVFFILGIIVFTARFLLSTSFNELQITALNSLAVWLFIFGITGLFLRYGSQHSHLMRYNSDASYWIYLIHLTFTLLLPAFIVDWDIPAFAKFIFVLATTSIICLVTYHYLVRSTFIGKFLNGRKYSIKKKSSKPEVITSEVIGGEVLTSERLGIKR